MLRWSAGLFRAFSSDSTRTIHEVTRNRTNENQFRFGVFSWIALPDLVHPCLGVIASDRKELDQTAWLLGVRVLPGQGTPVADHFRCDCVLCSGLRAFSLSQRERGIEKRASDTLDILI